MLALYFHAELLATRVQRIYKRIMKKFPQLCSLDEKSNTKALAGAFQQINIKMLSSHYRHYWCWFPDRAFTWTVVVVQGITGVGLRGGGS